MCRLVFIGLGCALAAIGFWISRSGVALAQESLTVVVEPTVFIQEHVDYQMNSSGSVQERVNIDILADGSRIETKTMAGFPDRMDVVFRRHLAADGRVEILVPHSGLRVPMVSQVKRATRDKLAVLGRAHCTSFEGVTFGKDMILGFEAETFTFQRPTGARRTYWAIPKLACALIQAKFEHVDEQGNIKLTGLIRTTEVLRRVRPEIWRADFRVAKPSEALRSLTDAVGRQPDEQEEKRLDADAQALPK